MNRCPKCGGTALVKSGKTARGTQRYECKICGTKSAGDRTVVTFKNKEQIKCKWCGSINIKKKGFTKANNQMYYCKDCCRKFVPAEFTRNLSLKEKNFIIKYHRHLGVSVVDIAKHLKRSTRTIYDFLLQIKEEK